MTSYGEAGNIWQTSITGASFERKQYLAGPTVAATAVATDPRQNIPKRRLVSRKMRRRSAPSRRVLHGVTITGVYMCWAL